MNPQRHGVWYRILSYLAFTGLPGYPFGKGSRNHVCGRLLESLIIMAEAYGKALNAATSHGFRRISSLAF